MPSAGAAVVMRPEAGALRHVRWLGGGSGGGKSTIARRLAERYGLRLYATDDVMAEHAGRTTAATSPRLHAFLAMTMDERWVSRSPREMLETFHWYAGEGFELIVEDLLTLPPDRIVLAEGFRLLPGLVRPLLSGPRQAVWLLPAPEFRRAALASRGGLWTIAGRTGDPARALDNLLARDAMFTERLRADLAALDLPAIEVAPGRAEDDLEAEVAATLGLG
jgi:hypothetical protein